MTNETINIDELLNELTEAAKVYYQEDTAIMTDDEYDTKLEYLEDLVNKGELELTEEQQHMADVVLGTITAGSEPEGTVITHDYPMLSLAKAKNEEELKRYHERLVSSGAKGFTLQMKFDGLALSAKYESGKLTQLATRGDGVRGELLSHLINHDEVTIVGLPNEIDHDEDFELRGELYITDAQFEEINKARVESTGEAFSNSRNAATGITKRSIKGLDYKAELTFTAYSAYHDGEQIEIDTIKNNEDISKVIEVTEKEVKRLSTDDLGLTSCTINSVKFEDLEKAVAVLGQLRELFTIPTDGVVIKPTNEIEMLHKMGYTSRFPIAYIAFKYPGAKSVSVVEEITVSVGKTGRLTPQARIAPVEVDGVIITNITCHNYSWLNEMGIRPGATVSVTRANDVIPAIHAVIDKGPNPAVKAPKNCPECGEKLHGDGEYAKTLLCTNLECPSRLLYYMKSIVGRNFLYIEGLGDVALEALVDQGILTSVVDLFKLTEDVLAEVPTGKTSTGNVRMLGAGNAKNIVASIERAKANTDSNKLLASLNFEGMGPGTAKRLIAHFGGIVEVLDVKPEDLTQVNQVGQSLVDSFNKHQSRAKEQLSELIELGVKINDPVVNENAGEKGTFSVSGGVEGFANRNDFVAHMESLGWEFHRSPKKTTDVLFADPNGTSSKIKKARANGTKIIDKLEDL